MEDLFSLYPPAPLSEEELQQQETTRTALKTRAATAKPKKRKAEGTTGSGNAATAPAVPPSVPDASAAEEEDDCDASKAADRRKKRVKPDKGGAMGPREYVPRIGSANYAFLVVMLQARGCYQSELASVADALAPFFHWCCATPCHAGSKERRAA